MAYVLDTNVIIHYLKKNESVQKSFRQAVIDGYTFLIPRAVDYEVCRGLELLSATKMATTYREITDPTGRCKIVDMGENIWEIAKRIYVNLRQKSFTVGEMDILIGAFCLHNDYTLVTANTKDFKNIEGLRLENWWVASN